MRKSPSVPVDKTSQTYTDAAEIMGSGKVPQNPSPTNPQVHSIDVEPAANGGVTVSHRMKTPPPTGKNASDYHDPSGPRETNVFSTPAEAHTHIGKLLGVHAAKAGGGLT